MRKSLALSLVGVVVVALVGCASDSDQPVLTEAQIRELAVQAESEGWFEQADALRDGVVNADEFADAFERFSGCLAERGYPRPETWISPIDGVTLLIEVADAGQTEEQKGIDTLECQDQFYSMVQGVYQDTQPYDMDEGIRQQAISCLTAQGYELDGDEDTPAEMGGPDAQRPDGSWSEQWLDATDCIQGAQLELFPEIPYSVITYR